MKYFGIELGAQTKYNKSTERCIVNGAHGGQDLAKLLTKFIDQFILCPTCKLPELKMSVGKRDLKISCDACGYSGVLNTPHKLAGYIQKNPPSVIDAKEEGGDDNAKVAGRKLTKEERKAARAAKKGAGKGDDGDEEGESLEGEFDDLDVAEEDEKEEGEVRHRKQKKDKSAKKSKSKEKTAEDDDAESASETEEERAERKKRKAEKKARKAAKEAAAAAGAKAAPAEDEWHTDVSKEAVRIRKEEERASMNKGKAVADDAEGEDGEAPLQQKEISNGYVTSNSQSKTDIEAANLLRTFLQQKRSTDQIIAELKRLSLARGYDDSQRFICLLNAICTPAEPKKLPSAIEKHSPVLRKLLGDSTQQVTQLLNSIEYFVGEAWNAAFLPVTPHVLKSLYEEDVLTEQQLIDWFDMPSDNPLLSAKNVSDLVRMKANVFVEWLKTADDDEEEED